MTYKHFKITDLTIKNFGGARSVTMSRLGQFVVLVGPNGCGKSSVLQVLGKLFGDIPDRQWRGGGEISGAFERDGDANGNSKVVGKIDVKVEGQLPKYDDVVGRYISAQRGYIQTPPRDVNDKERQLKENQEPWKMNGASHILSELAICINKCRDEVDQETREESLSLWGKYKHVIKALLNRELNWKHSHKSPETLNCQIRLDNIHWTEKTLSEGEINLLQILFRALVKDGETEQPSIILLDEPELHLHPDNQCRLIETLRKLIGDETQVFIATHSPYMLSCFEISEIRYISLPSSGTTQTVLSGVKVFTSGLIDLMGGQNAVSSQLALFNYAEWGILHTFLQECFNEPSTVSTASASDPQGQILRNEILNKNPIKLLDYGCGEGRLAMFLADHVPDLARKIHYVGYDKNQATISRIVTNFKDAFLDCRFDNKIPNGEQFSTILACNILHELSSFEEIRGACDTWLTLLDNEGDFIAIEDSEFQIGEIGFVMFNPEELKILFGEGENFQCSSRPRIFWMRWSKKQLKPPTEDNYRKALEHVKKRAGHELNRIEVNRKQLSGDLLARESRRFGFYTALYTNADRRLATTTRL